MVAVGDKIMIFGGRGAKQRFNDLHILDAKVNFSFIAVDRNCSIARKCFVANYMKVDSRTNVRVAFK